MTRLPRILCIAGPTGCGKTAAALHIADMLAGHGLAADIINADSRQVYRDFPLITAQPSADEQKRFPHFLYGWLESGQKISAGEWARLAGAAIAASLQKHHIPVLVGGTGFYLKTLLDGISEIPPVPDAVHHRIIHEREILGTEALYQRLAAADPEYASRIHPNDKQRIMRALEVWEATGHTFSWWHRQKTEPPAWEVLRLGIGLPLAELTPFLEKRILDMIAQGAVEEAGKAMLRCPDMNAPAWSGIGCAELGRYLQGAISMEECIRLWQSSTRAYAKRQWTWFRADRRILWHAPSDFGGALEAVREFFGLD